MSRGRGGRDNDKTEREGYERRIDNHIEKWEKTECVSLTRIDFVYAAVCLRGGPIISYDHH